jgi:large subunit ribosomal protein L10
MSDEEKKVSKNRQKKQALVDEITQKLSKAKALVFTNYQGLTHKQLEGFKKAIKPLKGEYVVAKNTLVLRSLEKAGVKIEDPASLDGPTGTMFIYGDVAEPLKSLAKIIKEFNLPTVKFGILDSQALTSEQVLKLATLPSRDTLIAQFVGGLKAPIYGLHRALNWNLQKLVLTLNAISQTKPALAVAADAPIPTPAAPVADVTSIVSEPEPETILAETSEEKKAEETVAETAKEEAKEETKNEISTSEGGEN